MNSFRVMIPFYPALNSDEPAVTITAIVSDPVLSVKSVVSSGERPAS